MEKVYILQPSYYKDFQCIGGECKYTCCAGWRISIDKYTYDNYMAVSDESMLKAFKENITVESKEPFSAKTVLDEGGNCKFLNEDGLCSIQLKYGPDYLSDTCLFHPRRLQSVGGKIEASMCMSCEAAAKLALLNAEPMVFEEVAHDTDEPFLLFGELKTSDYTSAVNGVDIFRKLRKTSIFIIQSRRYALWERLVILGLFTKKAEELFVNGKDGDVSALSDEFIERIESGAYDGLRDKLPDNEHIKINFILNTLTIKELCARPVLRECLAHMAVGFGIIEDNHEALDARSVAASYRSSLNDYFLPYFNGEDYLLENFLANLIFYSGFPFSYNHEAASGIFRNYTKLVIKYCLIRFLLIGMAGFYKDDLSLDEVIKGVTTFSRLFEHSPSTVEKILEFMDSKDMSGLGALSIMLKE